MYNLRITTNAKEVTAKLRAFVKEQHLAAARALNKTAEQARTEASTELRAAGYNIKASAIKRSFYIQRASKFRLEVSLKSTGLPITLINYRARKVKGGVRVQVKNGPSILRHAFIAAMPNGHRGVFVRTGTGHKVITDGKVKKRTGLPIKELYGPSIPSALNSQVVKPAIMRLIERKFPQIFERELKYIISRRG